MGAAEDEDDDTFSSGETGVSDARETGMSGIGEGVPVGQEASLSEEVMALGASSAAGGLHENRSGDAPENARQMARMRARIAAAQKALDDRATRHLKGLNEERSRLRTFEAALRRKAAQLLEAAKENQRLMNGANQLVQETVAAEADDLFLLAGAGSSAEPQAITGNEGGEDVNAVVGAEVEVEVAKDLPGKARVPRLLPERAAELAELVRSEQEELDRAESRFASLRTTIRRLRESVERSGSKQEQQKKELEERLQALRAEQAAVAGERDRVLAQLQEIDARATKTRLQLEQASRDGADLDNESDRLTHARRELVEREDELRTGLEVERRRMRVRHAELQSKEAELACAARERRREIEAEVSRRRAALELREAELRAHRAALEQAGRNELNKAAAELERVLDARLAGLEAEVASRGASSTKVPLAQKPELGSEALADAAGKRTNEKAGASTEPQQVTGLASMLRETIEGRARRLTAVQDELQALRGAIGRLDSPDAEEAGTAPADDAAADGTTSDVGRDRRRMRFELTGQMDNRHSYRADAEGPANEDPNAVMPGAGSANPAGPGGA
jgi:hypothetical protein